MPVVIEFLKANKWATGIIVILLIFLVRANLALSACQSKPPVIQTVTVKEKCAGKLEIRYQPGSPCPDIAAMVEGSSETSVTQTASAVIKDGVGIWLQGGYLATPYAGVGFTWNNYGISAKRSLEAWGIEAKYKILSF